ncbi:MAG: hypothetical protein HYV63_20790 [Candidatus Schekmanbacteria bacterium]|nr:hypothetical protein [Candidatus Schekmanbacteria bacterium]
MTGQRLSPPLIGGGQAKIVYDVSSAGAGPVVLTSVTPPTGPGVSHVYDSWPFPELTQLTNPYGGVAAHEHATRYRHVSDGLRTTRVPSRVLTARAHRGDFGSARWRYDYPETAEQYVRVVDLLDNVTRAFSTRGARNGRRKRSAAR